MIKVMFHGYPKLLFDLVMFRYPKLTIPLYPSSHFQDPPLTQEIKYREFNFDENI